MKLLETAEDCDMLCCPSVPLLLSLCTLQMFMLLLWPPMLCMHGRPLYFTTFFLFPN